MKPSRHDFDSLREKGEWFRPKIGETDWFCCFKVPNNVGNIDGGSAIYFPSVH